MVLGILYGYIEPLEDQKRLAFLVFVRIVERIKINRTRMVARPSPIRCCCTRYLTLIKWMNTAGNTVSYSVLSSRTMRAKLAVVDSDGFEQGRRTTGRPDSPAGSGQPA